ncbi:uncharacterized protein NPIL_536991 [Nephila pilipes]|uniref:Transposase n=1 Tax=Nephila pilipes TaxID=299642 RepID=A0A8X6NSM9_NEPPI|nr:uncharacterized protein NPIL_536991 [Nephila pilipes]
MHSQSVTVWRGFWAGDVNGPYFFKNEDAQSVNVTVTRYRDMITQIFLPKLDDSDVDDTRFQQDGATCHTAHETIQLLHEIFPARVHVW